MASLRNRECPCTSGLVYSACCAPYHGGAEPPDSEALMRSRFAAFALRDDEYLWRTLHPDHDDRARPRELYRRAVKGSSARYMGLDVRDRSPPDATGVARVLFVADVFDKGRDISFVELSDFLHDGDGFRYLSGIAVPKRAIRGALERLTIDAFWATQRR